jgi:hypothetical protein
MKLPDENSRSDRVDGVELGADPQFEHGWQRTQRIAWLALGLFVLAGLAGVFGRGPLSKAQLASDTGAATLEYERFARNKTPAKLKLKINIPGGVQGPLMISISRALLDTLRLEQALPTPAAVRADPRGAVLEFRAPQESGEFQITLTQEPSSPGIVEGSLALTSGGGRMSIRQVIYP